MQVKPVPRSALPGHRREWIARAIPAARARIQTRLPPAGRRSRPPTKIVPADTQVHRRERRRARAFGTEASAASGDLHGQGGCHGGRHGASAMHDPTDGWCAGRASSDGLCVARAARRRPRPHHGVVETRRDELTRGEVRHIRRRRTSLASIRPGRPAWGARRCVRRDRWRRRRDPSGQARPVARDRPAKRADCAHPETSKSSRPRRDAVRADVESQPPIRRIRDVRPLDRIERGAA